MSITYTAAVEANQNAHDKARNLFLYSYEAHRDMRCDRGEAFEKAATFVRLIPSLDSDAVTAVLSEMHQARRMLV